MLAHAQPIAGGRWVSAPPRMVPWAPGQDLRRAACQQTPSGATRCADNAPDRQLRLDR